MQEEGWPPPIREFVTAQHSEVFLPAPFSPALAPRQVGPLFEIRQYTLIPGGQIPAGSVSTIPCPLANAACATPIRSRSCTPATV